MKFLSFALKLVTHAVLWFALIVALANDMFGLENLLVFLTGFSAVLSVVGIVLHGGTKSINVPGRLLGRIGFVVLNLSRVMLVLLLAQSGHFFTASALAFLTLSYWLAFTGVLSAERAIKRFAVALSAEFAGIDPKSARNPAFDDLKTTSDEAKTASPGQPVPA
jgi:hypothetical protein